MVGVTEPEILHELKVIAGVDEEEEDNGEWQTMWCLVVQSSKDSTSPMSETCKIRVKFRDRKPD